MDIDAGYPSRINIPFCKNFDKDVGDSSSGNRGRAGVPPPVYLLILALHQVL